MKRPVLAAVAAAALVALVAVSLGSVASAPTAAQASPAPSPSWTTPTTASPSALRAESPVIVASGSTLLAVWVDDDNTGPPDSFGDPLTNQQVYQASSIDNGVSWSVASTISPRSTDRIRELTAVNHGANVTVAWIAQDSVTFLTQLFTVTSPDRGATWSVLPTRLSDPSVETSNVSLFASDASVVAIWVESIMSTVLLRSASATNSGQDWLPPVTVNPLPYPQMGMNTMQAASDHASITVAWVASEEEPGTSEVFDVVLSFNSTDAGQTWSPPTTHSRYPSTQARSTPVVATDGVRTGVLWTQRLGGGTTDTRAVFSSDGGVTWGPSSSISTADDVTPRDMLIDGSSLVATWVRFDGSVDLLESLNSTDGGRNWSMPVAVSNPALSISGGAAQIARSGSTLIAVWASFDGAFDRVFTSTSVDAGANWGPPLALSREDAFADSPTLLVTDTSAVVAWRSDNDNGGGSVQVSTLALPAPADEAAVPELAATGSENVTLILVVSGGLLLLGGAAITWSVIRARRAAKSLRVD